jgi:hypothetical protein
MMVAVGWVFINAVGKRHRPVKVSPADAMIDSLDSVLVQVVEPSARQEKRTGVIGKKRVLVYENH